MANNQYKNKVIYDGATLIDLTTDDVTAGDVLEGKKFHLPNGAPAVGTRPEGNVLIVDTQDSHGGTIRNISSITNSITLRTQTVSPGEYVQIVTADNVIREVVYIANVSSRTAGSGTSIQANLSPYTALTDNEEYKVVGRINIIDSNNNIIEYYNVNTTFEWKSASTNIVENDENAYIKRITLSKYDTNKVTFWIVFQKTATYGIQIKLNICEITDYDGLSEVIVNPPDYTNTLIKNFITRSSYLKTFPLSDEITTIGGYVFADCIYLESINLPNTLTYIGRYAFYNNTKLELTSLPESVTYIGDYAFCKCSNITLTNLPSNVGGNNGILNGHIFEDCTNLALTSLPNNIQTININAFYRCPNLALVSLPSSLTILYSYVFYDCTSLALTSLPSSVNLNNASYCFYNCSSLALSGTLTVSGTNIPNYCFYKCINITITKISSNIINIGAYAFGCCSSITSISSEGAISTLSSQAFHGSSEYPMQLTSVYFPNMTVSTLGTAFGSSSADNACKLLSIVDAGLIGTIGAQAFINCYSLQTLILRKTTLCSLGNVSAFTNTPMAGYNGLTGTVYVPSSLINSYQIGTNWSTLYNAGYITFSAIEGSDYEL